MSRSTGWVKSTLCLFFFFSSRRRHTRFDCDWSSDVCSSDLNPGRTSTACSSAERARRSVRVLGRARAAGNCPGDRKSVVEGKSVDPGGCRIIKKKNSDRLCRQSSLLISDLPYTAQLHHLGPS